jgi:hypothetical protein
MLPLSDSWQAVRASGMLFADTDLTTRSTALELAASIRMRPLAPARSTTGVATGRRAWKFSARSSRRRRRASAADVDTFRWASCIGSRFADSASIFAAQMKSFSDKPPIACVL